MLSSVNVCNKSLYNIDDGLGLKLSCYSSEDQRISRTGIVQSGWRSFHTAAPVVWIGTRFRFVRLDQIFRDDDDDDDEIDYIYRCAEKLESWVSLPDHFFLQACTVHTTGGGNVGKCGTLAVQMAFEHTIIM